MCVPPRALVLQNERRVEDAHRLFDFLGVGRGSPEEALMVKELQFEHAMTGTDPAMTKFEEIGRRMFKLKRRDESKLLQLMCGQSRSASILPTP